VKKMKGKEKSTHLPQRPRERLHRQRLLPLRPLRLLIHRHRHRHLRTSTSERHPRLLNGLREDREGVVQRSVGFFDHLAGRTTEDDGAGFTSGNTGELDELGMEEKGQ
jgi:hypothetical protein